MGQFSLMVATFRQFFMPKRPHTKCIFLQFSIPNRFFFFSKNWDLRHTEDVSSAAVRVPETLVTSSYAGELIFWRLETGQPYKKFNVSNPTVRIKIHYQLEKTKEKLLKEEYIHKKKSVVSSVIAFKDKRFSHQGNKISPIR